MKSKQAELTPKDRYEIFEEIFLGGMPEYWTLRPNRDTFFESYIATYLEKDVSRMINIGRIDDFRKFMRIVALRTSQQLDYTEIGNAVGIDASEIEDRSICIDGDIGKVLEVVQD